MPPTNPTSSVITEQLTRALGEAVVRIWSNLRQEVQNHLFQEAVTSQGEPIRSQLAVFLHDKHSRTSDRQPSRNDRTGQPWRLGRLLRRADVRHRVSPLHAKARKDRAGVS